MLLVPHWAGVPCPQGLASRNQWLVPLLIVGLGSDVKVLVYFAQLWDHGGDREDQVVQTFLKKKVFAEEEA